MVFFREFSLDLAEFHCCYREETVQGYSVFDLAFGRKERRCLTWGEQNMFGRAKSREDNYAYLFLFSIGLFCFGNKVRCNMTICWILDKEVRIK